MEIKSSKWTSKLGFIMTAAGAAVGLGNLQRFPQLVASHGGGAFLFLYILSVITLGFPLMLAEFSIGKFTKQNPIFAFKFITKKKSLWNLLGILGLAVAFFIFSYYTVSCSWTLLFIYKNIMGEVNNFKSCIHNPIKTFPILIIFQIIITIIVTRGLNKGVEKFSKVMMPFLFILQFVLIIKIFSLKGSYEGIKRYLVPDFTKLKPDSFLAALSQAFFSLCIGESILITYGSYVKDKENIVESATYIAMLDTAVAFFAGLIVYTGASIISIDNEGIGLTYDTLNAIFKNINYGKIYLFIYFLLLVIAGLTTCISLLEAVANSITIYLNKPKIWVVIFLSIIAFFLGLPSLYSKGGNKFLSNLTIFNHKGLIEIMDHFGGILMVLTGFLNTIFVGWIWKASNSAEYLSDNSRFFNKFKKLWIFHIKWSAPIIIIYIFISILNIF